MTDCPGITAALRLIPHAHLLRAALLTTVLAVWPLSVSEAQTDQEIIQELNSLWLVDRGTLDASEMWTQIDRIEFLVDVAGRAGSRTSGLLLLGDLYARVGREQACIEAYENAIAEAPGESTRQTALKGLRTAYERFERWHEAVATNETLIEALEAEMDWSAYARRNQPSSWREAMKWLGKHYEAQGDNLAAARQYQRITDRETKPRFRWGLLREQAELLNKAGMVSEARPLFAEAHVALGQMPDLPVNRLFLATEAGLIRGAHGDVISRDFLAEYEALVERYRGCGTCTLLYEYMIAMYTMTGGLEDLDEHDRVYVVDLLSSVIERAESAKLAGEEGLDNGALWTAYATAIDIMVHELEPTDEHVLHLLSGLGKSMGEEPRVAAFMRRSVSSIELRFPESTWDAYPELAELRELNEAEQDDDTNQFVSADQSQPQRSENHAEPEVSSTPTDEEPVVQVENVEVKEAPDEVGGKPDASEDVAGADKPVSDAPAMEVSTPTVESAHEENAPGEHHGDAEAEPEGGAEDSPSDEIETTSEAPGTFTEAETEAEAAPEPEMLEPVKLARVGETKDRPVAEEPAVKPIDAASEPPEPREATAEPVETTTDQTLKPIAQSEAAAPSSGRTDAGSPQFLRWSAVAVVLGIVLLVWIKAARR